METTDIGRRPSGLVECWIAGLLGLLPFQHSVPALMASRALGRGEMLLAGQMANASRPEEVGHRPADAYTHRGPVRPCFTNGFSPIRTGP